MLQAKSSLRLVISQLSLDKKPLKLKKNSKKVLTTTFTMIYHLKGEFLRVRTIKKGGYRDSHEFLLA
jgi:hypothetical protein